MASNPQPSLHEPAAADSTWGDRFSFRLWLACFLVMWLVCLVNLVIALWGR
jgi:hypothetical protein